MENHRTTPAAGAEPRPAAPARRAAPTWAAPAALGAVLLLAAALHGWALGSLGWGNTYYAAAVKSMGRDGTNFLFGSLDPAGVLTVDKPPAALWPQVVSTKVFGFHGWALLLPQVLEGVAAVLLLHRTVRRWAGEAAGLLAALVLTLTPVTVAINRDNNPDTLLVLLLVAAAYALTRALEAARAPDGRRATGWLCLCGALLGTGFLTKMLAAWMVVPAFAAAWLVGAGGRWAARLGRLLAAGAVLAVASLWWVVTVAAWPGDRPYIGGSTDGTAWDLVLGYNGLGRLTGASGGGAQSGGFGGEAGPGRLFNDQVAGQISWLLPVCAVALAVAAHRAVRWRRGPADGSTPPAAGWVLWGVWLVVAAAVFSTQRGVFHPYYTTQLAPAVAALSAGLAVTLARAHRRGSRRAPAVALATVVVTVGWAAAVIRRAPHWNGWLVWPVLAAGAVAAGLLLAVRRHRRAGTAGPAAAVAAVLLAPAVWTVTVPGTEQAMPGFNPVAGPAAGPPGEDATARLTPVQAKILRYVSARAGGERVTLAVERGASAAAPYLLGGGERVVAMGGFLGEDDAPSVAQLARWSAGGDLRYVLGPDRGAVGGPAFVRRTEWVAGHCARVPPSAYGAPPRPPSAPPSLGWLDDVVLYDCAPR
ncbi:ArnT family glycosyltransferase [Streptomyces pactum]|uniref:ArnT family glycosyltransferase n=1 Tax=Streptomyces pactum TaxID=68249 RepID=UPI0036F6849D